MKKRLLILAVSYLFLLSKCFLNFDFVQAQDRNQNNNDVNPLYVEPATQDFSKNPKLLARIMAGPHGYFRFINIIFSKEVCRRFEETLRGTPSFNLHGDAHIEQYAITDLGRGLTDFDDSSTGPALIDLLRFGVSLHLACRAHGWGDKANELFEKFLFGYRLGINQPDMKAEEPSLVKEIRSKFKYNRKKYLQWIDSIMEPTSQQEQKELFAAMQPYIESTIYQHPELKPEFFNIIKTGYLHMGIGSALDIKYLVRIRGKTDDFDDDVVIEIKQVRDLSGIDCITIAQKSDPFRVLVGQARIAYQPYRYLGYIRFHDHTFWIHAWVDNYQEVEIGKSFHSVKELEEVVVDIGVQLGQGHPKQIAAPLDIQLRQEQLRILSKYEPQIKTACRELADQTVAAWKKFCSNIVAMLRIIF
ncbi:MAG: DUF2252 family protein [bacterium]